MLTTNVKKVFDLGRRLVTVWLATAGGNLPHIAAARMQEGWDDRLVVAAWFCPRTLANLERNRHVSIVIWDPASETGFQVDGVVERIEEKSMLNGFAADPESATPLPQAERELEVRVTAILSFSPAAHSDMPLE